MNAGELTATARDLIARQTPTMVASGALYPSGDRLPVNPGGYRSRNGSRRGDWFTAVPK